MNLLRQVTLHKVSTRADKSASINFLTQLEQDGEAFKEIYELLNQNGILYFKPSGELTQQEIDEIENSTIEVEGKSKSQRLRNVLYRLWEQEETKVNFNDFYSQRMEQLIEQIKDRLI